MTNATTEAPHVIELKVQELQQLFNSMDPSPFHERDLDHDAEHFIVSWAQECHHRTPIKIVVHVTGSITGIENPQALVAESFRHYFEYRSAMTLRELKQLMREGRASLAIGLLFLIACQLIATSIQPADREHWQGIVREGLTIGGWVAMWKPLDIYLYRWWPIRRLMRLYDKLSRAEVELRLVSIPTP